MFNCCSCFKAPPKAPNQESLLERGEAATIGAAKGDDTGAASNPYSKTAVKAEVKITDPHDNTAFRDGPEV
ncbi:MAG: hypothetical protein Q7V63_05045 [Gammaproteobacteria bacterium]|nr:hypothetical protein [Gammaproteobacteria bacterium]